jgi:type I restriction enzyme S subunit
MTLVQLSQVCDFIKDGTHGSPERRTTGIPVLSAEHVNDGRLSFSTGRFTTETELAIFRKRLHPLPGDVLLTIVGTIGRTAIVTETKPFLFQRSVCVFRPRAGVLDSSYLRYSLESDSVRNQLERETRQVAQAGVYLESLNAIRIALPNFNQQRRIAKRLERADRLRRMRRYALELSYTFLQSVFLNIFMKGDEMQSVPLGELIRSGPTNGLYKEGEFFGEGVLFLDIKGLYSGLEANFTAARRVEVNEKEFAKYQLRDGDVLINRVSKKAEGVGKAVLVNNLNEPAVFESNMMRIRLNELKLLPAFLVHYLATPTSRRELLRRANVSNQASVNQDSINNLPVLAPDISEQQTFIRLAVEFQSFQVLHDEALRQAEHLFQTLLHQAFKGER